MKNIKRLTLVVAAAIVLTGCGIEAGSDGLGGHRLYTEDVKVNDKTVTCVVYDDSYHEQGGLSCDFGRG